MRSATRTLSLMMLLTPLAGCDDGADETPPDAGALDMAGSEASDAAPDGQTPDAGPAPIDIVGDYLDAFDTPHRITPDGWSQGPAEAASDTAFTHVDNAARVAVGQNAADHPFNPDAWSRFDYTFHAAGLWYCQSAFDAADEAAARATPAPDPSDPAAGGCGGFPWSQLVPTAAPIAPGAYLDAFDTAYTVAPGAITVGAGDDASVFVLTEVAADHAIAHNADDNPFSPGLWSRFDFTTADAQLYVCQSAYDAPSAADARAASADPSAPAEGGCGMFSWSGLSAAE